MFKKDFWTKEEIRTSHKFFSGISEFIFEQPIWRGRVLAQQECVDDIEKEQERLNKKLDLILDHLNLQYQPETETKEPAKLVEKVSNLICVGDYVTACAGGDWQPEELKKKKRGRPKGSKKK